MLQFLTDKIQRSIIKKKKKLGILTKKSLDWKSKEKTDQRNKSTRNSDRGVFKMDFKITLINIFKAFEGNTERSQLGSIKK